MPNQGGHGGQQHDVKEAKQDLRDAKQSGDQHDLKEARRDVRDEKQDKRDDMRDMRD